MKVRFPWLFGAPVAAAVLLWLVALFPDYLLHWDEVQLTLGLDSFDLRDHQPHPPGYYVFVALGRLAARFFAQPENGLRFVAALAAAGFVVLIGVWIPGRLSTGARLVLLTAAGAFVLCSPIMLLYSVSALTYTCEAVCWLAVLLAVGAHPRGRRLILLGIVIGLGGGLRQTIVLWSVAIVIVEALRDRGWLDRRQWLRLASGIVAGAALWAVPLLVETGGLAEYLAVSRPVVQGNIWEKSVFHAEPGVVVERLTGMVRDLWQSAGLLLVVAALGIALRFRRTTRAALARWDALPLGAAVAFAFYAAVIYDSDGYILATTVALAAYGILCAATLLCEVPEVRQWIWALGLVAVMLSMTLLPGGLLSRAERGYGQLAAHDAAVAARLTAIRNAFDPGSTFLVTSMEYWQWGLRHVQYYLPDYTVMQLVPDRFFVDTSTERPYLAARGKALRHFGPEEFEVSAHGVTGELRQLVYVIPHDVTRFITESCGPYLQPLRVTDEEALPVLPMSEAYRIYVARGQLHCRPSS